MLAPKGTELLIGVGFYLALTGLVVVFSSLFNRNIGHGGTAGPVPRPCRGRDGMLTRIIAGVTHLIWRIVSWRTVVQPVVRERIELYANVTTPAAGRSPQDWQTLFESAYKLLGILNEKAEALMVYSGVTLAVVSVANIGSKSHDVEIWHGWVTEQGLSIAIASVILASIFFSLVVVGIFWSFLEFAVPAPGRRDYEREWEGLLKVLVVRQRCYQIAWLLAIFALLLLVFFVFAFGL